MKNIVYIILILCCFLFLPGLKSSHGEVVAHPEDLQEHSSEINPSSIGPEMAVVRAAPKEGFMLSRAAWKRLKIQVTRLETAPPVIISQSALVYYQDQTGVFRFRDGWFFLVPITVLNKFPDSLKITSPELQKDDAVATHGVGFLRVAEMEIFGKNSAGHVH